MSGKRDRHGQLVYGYGHRMERKRWVPLVRTGKVSCWRCGDLIPAGAKWDFGHVDAEGRLAGFPPRHPEHRRCNRQTLLHAKAAGALAPVRRFSREW